MKMIKQLQESIRQNVSLALLEDVGDGDVTAGLIHENQQARAKIISREAAVVCGIPWVDEVFRQFDESTLIDWQVDEGDRIEPGQALCRIEGNARHILTCERTALNFLQTLSATATTTRRYAELISDTRCKILDTRKTIPGLRLAQKYAVKIGGGENHRVGLYDAVLIKENHIRSAGSISAAVKLAQSQHRNTLMIEVEVETIAELRQALSAGAGRIMLDNFSTEALRQAVTINQGTAELEASGNVNRQNIREIALTGVNYISLGALTKHIRAVDLSLLFEYRTEPSA